MSTSDSRQPIGSASVPRWSRAILGWRRLAGRLPLGLFALACIGSLLLGLVIGRAGNSENVEAAQAVERSVLPLVLDADGIWNSTAGDRIPVAEALVTLRHEDDRGPVQSWSEDWLTSYDGVLLQLAGLDLPIAARPVQRQFINAVTMSRDAVEVLSVAASSGDAGLRRALLIEVGRLRQRSEQLTQSARASTLDLFGRRADVSPLQPVSKFGGGAAQ